MRSSLVFCSVENNIVISDVAIGNFQVFKNRKMPGRMGGVQRTVKNVWVYQIDPARNLLYLKGQVTYNF